MRGALWAWVETIGSHGVSATFTGFGEHPWNEPIKHSLCLGEASDPSRVPAFPSHRDFLTRPKCPLLLGSRPQPDTTHLLTYPRALHAYTRVHLCRDTCVWVCQCAHMCAHGWHYTYTHGVFCECRYMCVACACTLPFTPMQTVFLGFPDAWEVPGPTREVLPGQV